jgi:hypothetical protein
MVARKRIGEYKNVTRLSSKTKENLKEWRRGRETSKVLKNIYLLV